MWRERGGGGKSCVFPERDRAQLWDNKKPESYGGDLNRGTKIWSLLTGVCGQLMKKRKWREQVLSDVGPTAFVSLAN